ncbi:MAG: DNA mismatch repair endonuclease MutL [bacterium]|nr:DNA mismatch repair endonuclease MutL [bacterium]
MRIKQLSKHLINQIAAGEVIERPASVVKELVENSIDASATKISVEVSNECRNLRIADNGCGIHPDDILRAVSKHATSKIETDEDLFNIATLGFRGEALSSIISIAKVTCTTRPKEFDYGTKVECENSNVKQAKTGCAVGTIMNIENLFYNIPARLKFLKSSKTEFAYIQELMQNLALINPHIAFDVKNDGKVMLKTSGNGDLTQTLKELYSGDIADKMKPVLKTDELSGLKISGLVSTPDYTRSSKKDFHIFINSRTVKCPIFMKSIDTAYKNMLSIGKYPFVVLNLEIAPTEVDVNVHPTKKEVRYKNTNQIFNFIYSAINLALSQSSFKEKEHIQNNNAFRDFQTSSNTQNDDVYVSDTQAPTLNLFNTSESVSYEPVDNVQPVYYNRDKYTPDNSSYVEVEEEQDKIIGQYKNTYILIEKENGLEIIDQHIAEERYIYEKLKAQKEITSQLLIISDILDISMTEAELLKQHKEKLEKFGYGIEFMKDTQIIFKKVPAMLSQTPVKELLTDILENISSDLDGLKEKILIMTSCKSAVKAGERLDMFRMKQIIKNWRTCEFPYTCPHGRPISKIIEHKDIAKFFERNK